MSTLIFSATHSVATHIYEEGWAKAADLIGEDRFFVHISFPASGETEGRWDRLQSGEDRIARPRFESRGRGLHLRDEDLLLFAASIRLTVSTMPDRVCVSDGVGNELPDMAVATASNIRASDRPTAPTESVPTAPTESTPTVSIEYIPIILTRHLPTIPTKHLPAVPTGLER